jgi:hypothetical protein
MEYFSNELRVQENCILPMVNKSEPFGKRDNAYTANGLLSHNSNPACLYCNEEGHFASKCSNITNHQSRKAILCRNSIVDVLFV